MKMKMKMKMKSFCRMQNFVRLYGEMLNIVQDLLSRRDLGNERAL